MNTRRTTTHSRITLFAATLLLLATHALAQSPGLTFAPETSVCLDNGRERTFSGLCVPKGGSADFTVQLASQPSADVTLTISKEDLRDSWAFTWSPANLTFTSANWNQAQTVTVSSSKHPTASWGQADLYLTPDSDDRNYDKLSRHLTRYRVYEYDTPALDFNPGAVTVNEGASGSYSVMLNTPPTANVTLTLSSEGDGDLTLDTDGSIDGNQNTITFTPEEWTWHRVHVFAAEDADDTHGSLTITHTAASDDADYNGMSRALTATENDNDATPPDPEPEPDPSPPTPAPQAGVVLSPTSSMCRDGGSLKPVQGLCVPMGGSADFTVRLATVPKANVTLDAITQNVRRGEHISVSPTSLDFTPDNWNETQTITATSSKQPPAAFGAITVYMRGTSDDPDYHERLALRAYTIQESDTAALVLGKTAVSVDEGLYTAYSVMLNTPPAANVTLTLSTSGSSDLSVDTDWNTPGNQNTVTFTPTDWEWHQISVLAAEDANLTDDSMTITHTSASSDATYNGLTATVSVNETDNDTPSLVVSSTAVTVPEGRSATYSVKLSNQPNGGVTVALEQGTSGDADLSASPMSLSFNMSTWNVAQTITLSAAQDGDDLSGTQTFRHTASGANFGSAPAVTVTASEGDDDKRGFVVNPAPGSVTIREGGSHAYTVKLGTQPTANVTVAVAASGDSDVTVSPASLTFTAQNYASAQTVTISAAEDNADYLDDSATVRHTVSTTDSIYSEFTIGDISVTAKDNDAALVLSATAVQIPENGTATYTVRLTNPPSADVVVTIAEGTGSNDDTSITVSSPSNKRLTFTPADWSAQTVTLRASSDSDRINGTRAITHTASGAAEFVGITASLTATARDAAARINVSKTTVDVPEEATATYDVSLNAQPAANVTVTIAEADTGNDTDADITVTDPAGKTLTFTPQNYATAQTVTLSAATDVDLADGRRAITHTASDAGNTKSGYAGVPVKSITAREDDNDTGGLEFDKDTVSVAENGTGTYRVRLTHKPNGTVNVSVRAATGGSNDTDITVRDTNDGSSGNQTGSIRFTADNYDAYRTVTLAARDDADKTSGSRTINHTANGGGYSGVTGSVTANEADDDHAIVITPATGVTIDEGSTATYTVKLATAPTANVTVTIAESATAPNNDPDITVTGPSNKTLIFTGTTWSTAQTVTLTAAQDSDRSDGSRTITHTAASTDANYSNLSVSLLASEDDDDSPGDHDTARGVSLNSANDSPYGIWSDGTTMWVLDDRDEKLYAYTLSTKARDTTKEFDLHDDNGNPRGIWSDGTTMWVVNATSSSPKLYAYTLATGARDTAKEFNLSTTGGNRFPRGIWSDGTTMYVANDASWGADRVYAYSLASGTRDTTKEFALHTTNTDAEGIWSDGKTIWVSDDGDGKLYAYTLASGARDTTREFDLHTDNASATGIWSDGVTMWVADYSDGKLYAYHAPPLTQRLIAADATASSMRLDIAWHTGGWWYKYTSPSGGQCSTAPATTASARAAGLSPDRAYTFAAYSDSACSNLLATAGSLSTKSSSLALSGFSKTTSDYDVTLTLANWDVSKDGKWYYKTNLSGSRGNCVEAATNPYTVDDFSFSANETHTFSAYSDSACGSASKIASAPPFKPGAGIPALTAGSITLSGATLTLSNFTGSWWHNSGYGATGCTRVSSNTYQATLSGLTSKTAYTYYAFSRSGCAQADTIDSASFTTAAVGDRDTAKDITLANYDYADIWSDGTTIWALNWSGKVLEAYTLATGARDTSKEITLHTDNARGYGVWSDGTTVWVADGDDSKLYAYTLADGTRQDGTGGTTNKEFDTHADNVDPAGIWSDGTTMWVADGSDNKVYAYTLAGGARDTAKEFDTHADNDYADGIWSNGVTMWVAGRYNSPKKAYAYNMASGAQDTAKEFALTTPSNIEPAGLWSDGTTMWVVNASDAKIYAYHAPPTITELIATDIVPTGATLNITWHTAAWWYQRTAPTGDATCRKVAANTATAALSGLTAGTSHTYKAYDKSGCASDNEIASVTFTTAAFGDRITGFALHSSNANPKGLWSNGTTAWVVDGTTNSEKVYAYTLVTGARNTSKEFSLHADNDFPTGIWSDGTTIWVSDEDDKLYAYKLVSGSNFGDRDTTKEFNLYTTWSGGNRYPEGLWSDGATIWVVDSSGKKVYAYTLAGGARDAAKEFNLHANNNYARGIWSDGTTMWVSERDEDTSDTDGKNERKLYAYTMADGARDTSREFDLAARVESGNTYHVLPNGLWSDGTTMWVLDANYSWLYSHYAFPPTKRLEATGIGHNGATLNITWHTDDWWYKRTAPSTTGCSKVSAGTTTAALSGLTSATSYTYKAYDKSSCRNANEIASVTFSTTTLTADDPSATTMRLTIANHTGDWYYKYTSPSSGQCSASAVTGTTTRATGLAINQSYTFAAYSDSSCSIRLTTASALSTWNPSLTAVAGSNAGEVNLTLSNWVITDFISVPPWVINKDGNWHVKYTTPPGGQCSTPQTALTATVTGLTSGTAHTFAAYSDSNCSKLIATASTVTPAAVSNRPGNNADIRAALATGPRTAGTGTARGGAAVAYTRSQGADAPLGPEMAGDAANGPADSHGQNAAALGSPGYVTNLASAQSGDSDIDAAQRQAVAFTTGPHPGGYVLKTFTAALRKVSGDADLVLTLHKTADAADGPDSQPSATVLATLLGTAPASGAFADVTYTCSGLDSCRLEPDTTYFVVAASSGSGAYAWAYVASANLYTETTEPQDSGWDIGTGHASQDGDGWTSWGDWHHARLDFEAISSPAVTVGNLDQAVHDDACFPSGDTKCAVAFTTGPSPDGYTLDAITARFRDADDPDGKLGDIAVTLHADGGGVPGQTLATLIGANPDTAGDTTYICFGLEGCALKPNTTYFVQITASAGKYLNEAYEWASTLSDHETAIPKGNGWTLANGTVRYGSSLNQVQGRLWVKYRDVGLLKVRATTN